ncbi:MAG: 4Fe-4S binding protein [Candidatus Aenigmatarchaeota archaeon]
MKTEDEIKQRTESKEIGQQTFWRVFRPIVDRKKCNNCGRCVVVCPHEAIVIGSSVKIDFSKCDGCLICLRQCPEGAISEQRE